MNDFDKGILAGKEWCKKFKRLRKGTEVSFFPPEGTSPFLNGFAEGTIAYKGSSRWNFTGQTNTVKKI